ncbi:MAG: DUF3604 domain-containing protein [Paraglaciecola sp.]|uniref:DUF3604 domain-containing protein n=1 Tax=Paraglaciecola sp. TaxID=1920173 RepID=UPI0032975DC1
MRRIVIIFAVIVLMGAWFFSGSMPDFSYKILPGYFKDSNLYWKESPFSKTSVSQARFPVAVVDKAKVSQVTSLTALGVDSKTQILFGDTHVHTTNSSDAFMFSLPLMHGAQGAFPPGYACDYARFVSQLDFYFLTDHSESYTPERWSDAVESINKCNQASTSSNGQEEGYQDTYAFMGYEWTQVGTTKEEHYGHHNVLFKDTTPETLPSRPIAAKVKVSTVAKRDSTSKLSMMLKLLDPRHKDYYAAYNKLIDSMANTPNCEKGVPSNELPSNCYEEAITKAELYNKLNEWGIDTIVVPHGMAWGLYTPPDASWETHLNTDNVNNVLSPLIEVYSGHGSAEEYRDYEIRPKNKEGEFYCAKPTEDYLPGCWQAGEIIKKRCLAEGEPVDECQNRAVVARQNFVDVASKNGFLTVPSHQPDEWLDAEQARDMFNPSFSYRPKKSAQYGLALRNFDDENNPIGFQWGFVGSTDTHSARTGHGFKQVGRVFTSEANGPRSHFWESLMLPNDGEATAHSRTQKEYDPSTLKLRAAQVERVGSFLYLGGLAGVHVDERSRDGIWKGLKAKRVYGTSGHKILLWFDMINEAKQLTAPMGSTVQRKQNPTFKVSAVGSPIQAPGCPEYIKTSLDSNKLEKMSLGECYNPTDDRYNIQRIEITRIKPQSYPNEPVDSLIDHKWKVFQCPKNSPKCEITFTDEEYSQMGRDTVYYARVIEAAIPMINANTMRTKFNDKGEAVSVDLCLGSYLTPQSDNCLAEEGHRAWSSPIFVNYQ